MKNECADNCCLKKVLINLKIKLSNKFSFFEMQNKKANQFFLFEMQT